MLVLPRFRVPRLQGGLMRIEVVTPSPLPAARTPLGVPARYGQPRDVAPCNAHGQ